MQMLITDTVSRLSGQDVFRKNILIIIIQTCRNGQKLCSSKLQKKAHYKINAYNTLAIRMKTNLRC